MKKIVLWILLGIWMPLWSPVFAAIGLYADERFGAVLGEIIPLFSDKTGFEVEVTTGTSSELAQRIIQGETPDVFFPFGGECMRELASLGLVDAALKRNILLLSEERAPADSGFLDSNYAYAAVLTHAKERIPAMALLEFMMSGEAREYFERHQFQVP